MFTKVLNLALNLYSCGTELIQTDFCTHIYMQTKLYVSHESRMALFLVELTTYIYILGFPPCDHVTSTASMVTSIFFFWEGGANNLFVCINGFI